MEVYEQINLLLEEKNLTKKEFAQRLLALEPKSKRTGETMSEKAVYAYLSGKSVINADLLPYMAEALDIPEQALFEDNAKTRLKLIKYLLRTSNKKEQNAISSYYLEHISLKSHSNIVNLLQFASETSLKKIEKLLMEFKSINDKL